MWIYFLQYKQLLQWAVADAALKDSRSVDRNFFYQGYYVGWMDLRSESNPT